MPDRIRVVVRDDGLYLDAKAVVAMLRDRARQYVERAEQLVAEATDPGTIVDPDALDLIRPLDEALACRMVAEELEQRADALDTIG